MIRLRIRELAEGQGYSLATFQRAAKLPGTSARRLWYSTNDGTPSGKPLKAISLATVEAVADFLRVEPGAFALKAVTTRAFREDPNNSAQCGRCSDDK